MGTKEKGNEPKEIRWLRVSRHQERVPVESYVCIFALDKLLLPIAPHIRNRPWGLE